MMAALLYMREPKEDVSVLHNMPRTKKGMIPRRRDVLIKRMIPVDDSRYTGEKLRRLRAERGVGRPPAR
jgi:hypothetical protein